MKAISLLTLLAISLLASPGFAWPIFTYPDKELLLHFKYLTDNSCPAGQVKSINNLSINIQCSNGSCPPNWEWISRSDEKCHDFYDTDFLGYTVMHFPRDSFPNYSMVIASYGSKSTGKVFFKYIMTTPRGQYWYCIEQMLENRIIITCACDT